MIIHAQRLTAENFRPFGEVLEVSGHIPEEINQGNTQKYADLADIRISMGGRVQFSIYRSAPIELPFHIRLMERHPLGSQLFYPLHQQPFPVIVAPANAIPGADSIQAFISNGQQGINLHANVWHHYQLTLGQAADYIVVDRQGPGNNYQEHRLHEDLYLHL